MIYLMRAFVLVLFLNNFHLSYAQVSQTNRFEKEQKSADNHYFMFPMGVDGVVLLRDKIKFIPGGKKIWELIWLDEDLNEKWYTELELGSRLEIAGFDAFDGDLYFLLREGSNNRSGMELIKIRADLETERFQIENELRYDLTHFIVIKNSVILGGYVTQQPAIVIYNLNSDKPSPTVLPGYFLKNSEIVDLKLNTNGTFNVMLFEQTSVETKKLKLKTYDAKGNLLIEDEFFVDNQLKLHTGTSSSLVRDDMLLFGTFGNRTSNQSFGMFTALVDPFTDHEINFLHYSRLESFFDYMGEKKARKYKRRAEKLRSRGKDMEFGSNLLPISMFEDEQGFVLYAEAFQQSSVPHPQPSFYGSDYYNPFFNQNYGYNRRFYAPHYYGYPYGPGTQTMSNEKRFTQSLLIAFDQNGKLKWEVSFPFKNQKKSQAEQISDIYLDDGNAYVFYKYEKEILLNKYNFELQEMIEETLPIMLNHPEEVLRSENKEEGAVKYWYNNHMLVWGYQSIKGAGKELESENRNVFYINKITID
jgi:hypothetical protein